MTWFADLPHDRAGGDGGVRSITQCVVIHATDNTASAAAEAHYAESRADGTSAHFYSDESTAIQALDTDHIAFGCYPMGNSRSVQFEICGLSNQLTDASLRKIAPVVARVCQEYGLPIRKISSADLVSGAKGICGHIDVTHAWQQGDHTDPGTSFPWAAFIGYVQAAVSAPAGDEEDDMFAMNLAIPHKVPVWGKDADGNDAIVDYRWPDQWPNGYVSYTIPTVNKGIVPWGAAWLSACNDTFAHRYAVRVAGGNGNAKVYADPWVLSSLQREYAPLADNTACISLVRTPVDDKDLMTTPVSVCVEYARR